MSLKTMPDKFSDFGRIFHPKRVVVAGVGSEGFGFGRGILFSLLRIGFEGELFPVNPKGGSVAGLNMYKSISDIPGEIDFAIIAVPAQLVPETLIACREKGAAGAEILSSGFRETGTPEGIELDEEIKKIASSGIRLIGPNCFGIYCPRSGLTVLPGPDLSRKEGRVSFLSQSGGHAVDFSHMGKWRGIHFSKVVSFGNGADLRETELLEYLGHDPDTEIVCLYIEGVDDGKKFFTVLREVAAEKPVIVLKGGLSEAGSRAAASHTASMGGSRIIWESVFRQCNAVQAADLQELADITLAFSALPRGEYRGISVIGGGGALGVAASDTAESYGLIIPRLRDDIQKKIYELLPKPGSSPANPIDIANPYVPPDALRRILLAASEDERIDIHVVVQLLYHYKALSLMLGSKSMKDITPYQKLAEACRDAKEKTAKPVVLVLPNYKQETDAMEIEEIMRETRKLFTEYGIPVYDDLKSVFRAVSAVSRHHERRRIISG